MCFDGEFGEHRKLSLVNQGHKKGKPAEDLRLWRKHGFYEDLDSSVVLQLTMESVHASSGSSWCAYSGLKGE
jgi:hypothetical protein